MAVDRMQAQRFEQKYLISQDEALRVRDFVQPYLEIDEYGVGRPDLSYDVHSLYLDSDSLRTYWDTINGNRNRFKLRVRFYSANPNDPVFFEIKRRVNNCIMKQRGGVKAAVLPLLLAGHLPEPDHLLKFTPKALVAVQNFSRLMLQIQAKPKVHIAYLREAYANDPGTVRVTMDRQVRAQPNLDGKLSTVMADPRHSFQPHVILELKFTDRFPNWFGDLVRHFGFLQRGAAKYCASVQAIGAGPLHALGGVVPEEEVQVRDY
jgi:hypothetical protein